MTTRLMIAVAMMFASTLPAQAAGEVAAGQAKAAACAGCHGANGNSANAAFPSLAGQHANYIAKQLREYKAGVRANAMMAGMAAPLTEEDMANLGAYYASQAKSALPAEGQDAELIARGKRLYQAGDAAKGVAACAACHGHQGYGNPGAGYPALRSQYAAYTELTLKAFRDGSRANDAQAVMRQIATKLSDEDIRALAAYTATLY
ncbi:MAG: c-type cytochrome [Gammaproteobacteria bacterium]|nr:c-type cytochrome [Gammaproteobacteria bacterium]